jgi:hypothetical protein
MKKIISIIAALSSLSTIACGGGDTVSRVSSGVESGGVYNEDTNEDGTTTPSTNNSAGSSNEEGSGTVVEQVILEDELKISDKEKSLINGPKIKKKEDDRECDK